MAVRCEIQSAMKLISIFRPVAPFSSCGRKLYSSGGSKAPPKSPSAGSTSAAAINVPGLSKNVLDVPNSEVGPGASKNTGYKNPEYFSYHNMSYFEAEIEMLQFRCPQPSAVKK